MRSAAVQTAGHAPCYSPLGVVDTLLLQDLGNNGDGRVDWVADDENKCLGSIGGNTNGNVSDNGGVDVEEVVSGHAWLTGDTSGDDDDVRALEGLVQTAVRRQVALNDGGSVDVGDVSGNTWCVDAVGRGRDGGVSGVNWSCADSAC